MMLKGPMFYEGLLRVAMILKGPGIPSGSVLEDPVSNTDLAPLFLIGRVSPQMSKCMAGA